MKNIRTIAYSAICISLMTVCSWISIPFTVPVTLQTFAVFFIAAVLGPWRGAVTVCAYILLGIAGVPVFSGFSAGLQVILGPTGGYILGFLPAVMISGIFPKTGSLISSVCAMIIGLLVCYVSGTAWFMLVYSSGTGLGAALSMCVIPYIIPDIAKIFLAAYVSRKLHTVNVNVR